ncbi:hypothetical protein OHA18_24100 [Kribbella sp. NBC_00709]|uniref:hypothetical protein n=1 Tax=Kribbella sp. NBC_00709 TaxID=2975972 RepID=UPI002E2C784D|nr:hypothetical protein [Kribbella sp. NBC_00709]
MGILDRTVTTVFVLLVGVALVGVAADLGAVMGPDDARELHAYRTAPHCSTAPSAPAECRWTEEFTVSDVDVVPEYKRGDRRAVLSRPSGASWTVGFNRSGPVLEKLHEGERVTGTVWRGRITGITADGAAQETQKAPDGATGPDLFALILASSGLLAVGASAWRLRRRRAAPTRAMEATFVLSIGMLPLGLFTVGSPLFLSVFLPVSVAENFWLLAAIFCAGAVWMTVATHRSLRNEVRLPGKPI